MVEELDIIPTEPNDPFEIDEEDKKELSEVHLPYWAPRTCVAKWSKRVPFPEKNARQRIAYVGNLPPQRRVPFPAGFSGPLPDRLQGLPRKGPKTAEGLGSNEPEFDRDKKIFMKAW